MNTREAATLLSYVVAAMPNLQDKDLSATVTLWAVAMPDIPFEIGQRAVLKILREKKIPTVPLPGEIIDTVKQIVNGENKVNAPSDYEAWQEVRRKIDFYKPEIKWSHPLIAETVKIIGSRNICGGDYGVADRFMRVYNRLARRANDEYENKITLNISNAATGNLIDFVAKNKQIPL